jgi:uncharacterized protein YjbJ (UPF0337 family)
MQSSTQDIFTGKWHELKGQLRQKWGKLTDDDITRMGGRMEELSGTLQKHYGYDRAKAEDEIREWLEGFDGSR